MAWGDSGLHRGFRGFVEFIGPREFKGAAG